MGAMLVKTGMPFCLSRGCASHVLLDGSSYVSLWLLQVPRVGGGVEVVGTGGVYLTPACLGIARQKNIAENAFKV